jgi:hypothetical protein
VTTEEPFVTDSPLRELARRYEMTYRVSPMVGSDPEWSPQKVGFDVEMSAIADPSAPSRDRPPPSYAALPSSYAALRQVAEWALGGGGADVCITIDAFDDRVVQRPRANAWVVELVAHVLHCDDVRRELDEGERSYVSGVKHRLASLGVAED